ncbi:hypothetical protein FHX14_000037 [Rhizobium sp. BK619]|uniref:hypothetical protein n=1 Tax=Rhizobium sp. BK619 TaxID=2586989 RepID=UPI0016198B6B|nr:hypothetical protein [Rhizobium sp. BK619]MBB3643878.1 hypothetical protein [Rhizobium sp. BK619]
MHGVADFFYPATSGKTVCSDGVERSLGNEQFLNRLHEFVRTQIRQSASRELLASELEHLAAFVRRLNDLASKGVHADVSYNEARQGLIGLYFFLSNLIQHLTQKSELIDRDMAEISQS